MSRGFSRSLIASLLAIACVGGMSACKSAPVTEAPVSTPPAFESGPGAPRAERVEETGGFGEAEPSSGDMRDDSTAERLNAQGVLKRVYFDFDKFDLTPDAMRTLGDNAGRIRENAQFKVRVEGHCDERGTVEYNLALGEKRARAARDYLISLGTPARGLSIVSYGKERPLDPGHSEAAWARNRRAEFIFLAE